jgi:hypothetical protein
VAIDKSGHFLGHMSETPQDNKVHASILIKLRFVCVCVYVCVLQKKSTQPLPDKTRHIGVREASN